ncbi:MAG: kinase [Gammaproteobacteria bacterium RIFCSPLOWO2_02_FULL_61_13]|nr:MAG: kinase [Gammaproteobacteria bacterium RIFCSPLOWO2_02_FULL_61_13]
MIISRTPFRVSFFGGGTDYPTWYRENGGQVLSTSIDKYCYISVRHLPPFFEHRYRVVYSKIENVGHYDEIQHPAVRAVLGHLGCEQGLEIHHDGDLPARAGLGSSSSFTVGLLAAIHALRGEYRSAQQLGAEAIHVEQELIRESVGSQDQIAVAYGGFNHIRFLPDGDIKVQPIILPLARVAELQDHLLLFFTGLSREASTIARSKIENLPRRRSQLAAMNGHVDAAIRLLGDGQADLAQFGELLHETWMHKRELSDQVSNGDIDAMYESARRAGARGGKLLGAGGGGFLLLFAPPERHAAVRAALSALTHVPFAFEHEGARIVLYQPDRKAGH